MKRSGPRSIAPTIVAACIVALGLISAAIIDSHRFSPAIAGSRSAPPIAQEAAREQFRSQVLAAPALQIYNTGNSAYYTLKGVNVTRVEYHAGDDTLTIVYDVLGQKASGPIAQDLENGATRFRNDGYGHYHGTVVLDKIGEDHDSADVTIQ